MRRERVGARGKRRGKRDSGGAGGGLEGERRDERDSEGAGGGLRRERKGAGEGGRFLGR